MDTTDKIRLVVHNSDFMRKKSLQPHGFEPTTVKIWPLASKGPLMIPKLVAAPLRTLVAVAIQLRVSQPPREVGVASYYCFDYKRL